MEKPINTLTGTPPRLFPTLLKGFNTIANHWYLILFPVAIDVVLWLGPKIKLKTLLTPIIDTMTQNVLKISPAEMLPTAQTYQALWDQLINQFNLTTLIRTIPIGVPSIIARQSPLTSPLGPGISYELPTVNWIFIVLGILLLLGFLLGSIYFILVSQVTAPETGKMGLKEVFSAYLQSLVMFCLMIILLVLISVPLLMLLSILSLINPAIGQFFMLVAAFLLLWLLMPLVFSPHGIFVLKQKALPSMLISVRLVRLFLPGTGLFVMTSILISEGLNLLWTIPDPNSWMTMIGIGGHAFIITGLLAASFIYYREGLKWMQDNLQKMAEATKMQQENGGTTLEQR
ncbi:MAG: hypothetical protein Q8R09_04250 [Anaerolineaceae bacterium]|nr:hypothetical protein [Anaerolineaceae bacterium]